VGNPAPPLPLSSEDFISLIIHSLPFEIISFVFFHSPLFCAEFKSEPKSL